MAATDYHALYQSEKAKREQAETLVRVAGHLNAQLDLDASLDVICQSVASMINAPIVTISLYDESRQELCLAHAVGLPSTLRQMLGPLPREVYNRYTQESGSIIIVSNVQDLSDLPNADIYRQLDLRTTVGISILLHGQLIGRMNIGVVGQIRHFTEREIALLQGIVDQAAVAIHRAQLHQQMQQYAGELEERVAQRTAALAASNHEKEEALEALRAYTDELQVHNAELDAFAHTVAHDLHSPLSVLIGYTDLLMAEDEPLSPELQAHYLRKIMQQGYRLHNIVNEILVLASVRKAEVQIEPITNMADLVVNALERVSRLVEEHQAKIIMPPTWPTAFGYGPWVEEVWANYLSNAVKYGGQPPTLELKATVAHNLVRFGVQDNGAGLSAEEQTRLFAPFTRLHQVRISGHGLGLSIVQRIMDKLDGRVGVISQPGQGSFFYFELPADK